MRLLIGPPGSGKTTQVLEEFVAASRGGGARLVVPTATMAEHLRHELARRGCHVRPRPSPPWPGSWASWPAGAHRRSAGACARRRLRASEAARPVRPLRDTPGLASALGCRARGAGQRRRRRPRAGILRSAWRGPSAPGPRPPLRSGGRRAPRCRPLPARAGAGRGVAAHRSAAAAVLRRLVRRLLPLFLRRARVPVRAGRRSASDGHVARVEGARPATDRLRQKGRAWNSFRSAARGRGPFSCAPPRATTRSKRPCCA